MAQQTALDFFLMKLVDLEIGKTFYPNQHQDLQDAFKQAKAMEKEQIIEAFEHGHTNGVDKSFCMDNPMLKNSEQYYNEKYNNIDDAH